MLADFSKLWGEILILSHHLQENEEMRKKMENLEKALLSKQAPKKSETGSIRSKVPLQTKPHASKKMDADSDQQSEPSDGEGEELSEAAKNQRLRRICERKGSGKLNAPEEIHNLWKKGGHSREELRQMLEDADWDKDWFYLLLLCIDRNFNWKTSGQTFLTTAYVIL